MPFQFPWRRNPEPDPVFSVDKNLERSAKRFEEWVTAHPTALDPAEQNFGRRMDRALESIRGSDADAALPNQIANDAAAYLGEALRKDYPEAVWREDEMYGLHLANLANMPHARFLALHATQKKWELRDKLSLAKFLESAPARIEAESKLPHLSQTSDIKWQGRIGEEARSAAEHHAQAFRKYWSDRHQSELPPTLLGVREMDKFLRSNYLLNFLGEEQLIAAGFFLGEVARGLFGGHWDFSRSSNRINAALVYPELEFYPVGRIFKMMTEQPEGEPLDEYVRLIPSARKAVREEKR
ncbi:hypothetical protein BH09SUM1_BH09SUM1_32880 [soil metagenome]